MRVKRTVIVDTVLPAWKLYSLILHVHVEGLQSHHPYLVEPLLLHANIHAWFLSLVATNLLIVAILGTVHLVQFPLLRSASVGMLSFAIFLAGQRT